MELNREQIKKELALFIDDNPVELHLNHRKTSILWDYIKSALAVITTDEQKIKELTEENERLRSANEELGRHCVDLTAEFCHCVDIKADTLTDFKNRLTRAVSIYTNRDYVNVCAWFRLIDHIIEEMLEGGNGNGN